MTTVSPIRRLKSPNLLIWAGSRLSYSGTWCQFTPPKTPVVLESVDDPALTASVEGTIDTGATHSAVSEAIADALNPRPLHHVRVQTPSKVEWWPMHVVRVILDTETEPLRPRGVLEAPSSWEGERMLIGRDIVQCGSLHVEDQRFVLSLHP